MRFTRAFTAIALLASGLTFGSASSSTPAFASSGLDDRLIISLPEGVRTGSWLSGATNIVDLTLMRSLGDDMGVYAADKTLNDVGLAVLERDLRAVDPGVTVERDEWVTPAAINDTFYNSYQSNLYGSYGVNAETAWAITKGAGETVAVLDTGVRLTHADLVGRTVGGYDFVPDLLSNDDDGWDADPTDPGDYNTDEGVCEVGESSWHGTHVAGTIAATQNNGIGITGLAPESLILPVRVLGRCGGYTSDIIDGLRWAAGIDIGYGVPVNENPARIANLSLGASNSPCSTVWTNALEAVEEMGMLVVVAAGNDDVDASTASPAGCEAPNIITVSNIIDSDFSMGGTDFHGGLLSDYAGSNFGAVVDIAAPGTLIAATVDSGDTVPVGDGYALMSGTSMAAPHVAAAAALVWSANPTYTLAQVRSALLTTVKAFPTTLTGGGAIPADEDCRLKLCGSGILDAGAAVTLAAANIAPGAPQNVAVVRDGTSATVTWDAPTITGSSAITKYTVYRGATTACSDVATTTCTVTGLPLGTHTFTVTATNSAGTGPASAESNSISILTIPTAPQNATATRIERSITVSWTAPSSSGGTSITGYTVHDAAGGTHVVSGETLSHTIDDLALGQTYTFTVSATNSEGTSPNATANAVTIPSSVSAPTNVQVTVDGTSKFDVSWTAGTGGLTANWYKVTALPSGNSCETNGSSCSIYGLNPGTTYSVVVTAGGVVGANASSSSVSATTVSLPTTTTTTIARTTTTIARTTTTTTVPRAPALVRSVKRSSRTALTKILTVPAGYKAKWTATGPCKVSGTVLVATTKKGTCKVTLKATRGTKTTTKVASVKVT